MTDLRHNEHDPGTGFERQDLGSRPIFGFLISLIIIGIFVYYGVWGIFYVLDTYYKKREAAVSPLVQQQANTRTVERGAIEKTFPEPRLETDERSEINDFRIAEEQKLNSYGWVDQNQGVVHMPITRAMELVAQRGLPTNPHAGSAPLSPVNLATAAAAAADTSNAPKNTAGKQTKKGK
jgi:hypothetical protein